MDKKINFVTGNKGKWEIGRDVFSKYGLTLVAPNNPAPTIK